MPTAALAKVLSASGVFGSSSPARAMTNVDTSDFFQQDITLVPEPPDSAFGAER
jgi:hypothetical protein